MTDSNISNNSGATTAPTKRRTGWFATGIILWGLVICAVVGTFVFRPKPQPAGDEELPVIVLDDPAKGTASSTSKEGSTQNATAPKTPWNPNGIEDFSLTERSGKTITKADLLGHDWIVSFIFINCAGPCPKVTGQMHELQKDLKETDVRLLTITVDPKTDTPERLQKYAEVFSADPERWLFLTGEEEKVYKLIQGSFQSYIEQAKGEDRKPGFEVAHETNLLHLNKKGVVVGKYKALDAVEMAKLRQDMKAK
ncbi:MAG: SCO family protein [Planctomycetaceae bacterium]